MDELFLVVFVGGYAFTKEKHPQANTAFNALMEQADEIIVYKGSEQYLTLTQALALEMAEVEGKQDIRVYNNCVEKGSPEELECNLAIYYREITNQTSRSRNAVFSYTISIKNGEAKVTSDVKMAVYN